MGRMELGILGTWMILADFFFNTNHITAQCAFLREFRNGIHEGFRRRFNGATHRLLLYMLPSDGVRIPVQDAIHMDHSKKSLMKLRSQPPPTMMKRSFLMVNNCLLVGP